MPEPFAARAIEPIGLRAAGRADIHGRVEGSRFHLLGVVGWELIMSAIPPAKNIALAGILLGAAAIAVAQSATPGTVKTGYAPINQLNLYYEIHGSGAPLVVLHGGLGSTEMMSHVVSALSPTHQVIAVDLQAHGRTADIDRPLSYEAMADDIAALLNFMNIVQADVMGYSLGGGVSVQLTIRHPAMVRKLVVVSTVFQRNGWYPEILASMGQLGPAAAEAMKPSGLYKTYVSIAPKPSDWPVLVTKVGDLLKKEYDWSKDVAAITTPTLLVFGDADAILPAHMVEFFTLLGGGRKDPGWDRSGMSKARLAILPGITHYDIIDSSALVTAVQPFLEASHSR